MTCVIRLAFAIAVSVLIHTATNGQTTPRTGNNWQQIVPLHTTKSDLEKWFGKPLSQEKFVGIYEEQSGRITVFFVGAKDPDGLTCNWGVASDTVNTFTIFFRDPIIVSQIGFPLDGFVREETDEGQPGRVTYTNTSKGISFVAYKDPRGAEWITMLQYNPTSQAIRSKCVTVENRGELKP